jgi:hypothetical protein
MMILKDRKMQIAVDAVDNDKESSRRLCVRIMQVANGNEESGKDAGTK